MNNIHLPSWGEQQSLFKLSYADAETCNHLESVVSVKSPDDQARRYDLISNLHRITQHLIFNVVILSWEPRKWPSHVSPKEQNLPSPLQEGSIEGTFVEHVSHADKERQSAPETSPDVEIVERPE